MKRLSNIFRSIGRIAIALLIFIGICALAFVLWQPGTQVLDGRHDRGRNAIWISHGWLGADDWFIRNQKTNQFDSYRNVANIRALADRLHKHGISDVFPHLCPAEPTGQLAKTDPAQVERFLDGFEGFRVMPWIGGPNDGGAQIHDSTWRIKFVKNVRVLLLHHKRLAGIHLNVEPLPSGDKDFLLLLEELRAALPEGKILSVAAYPPPTIWHRFPDVHWEEDYFRQVAKRCDQVAVMMYDAGQKFSKPYQRLMADWTKEVIAWSEGSQVLLGVPAYEDAKADYHDFHIENVTNAVRGIHAGLSSQTLADTYQGIAIYCDWETSPTEWTFLENEFLRH